MGGTSGAAERPFATASKDRMCEDQANSEGSSAEVRGRWRKASAQPEKQRVSRRHGRPIALTRRDRGFERESVDFG